MAATQHHLASDALQAVIAFRADLVCRRDDGHWMIEDPVSGDFFQLGVYEYEFSRKLDGETRLSDALSGHCRDYPDSPIGEFEALELCQWFINNQLAQSEGSADSDRMNQRFRNAMRHQFLERINPILFRFAARRPGQFIDRVSSAFGWLFGIPATVVACCFILFALVAVGEHWHELSLMRSQIFTKQFLLTIGIASIALKIIHEFGHAIACRRYGGSVGEIGILLVLFVPLAYVDVNSIWRIRSRLQRVHVALAGMYLEAIVAASAILLWCASSNAELRFLCFSVAITAGLTTVLFNANPLMRFDGYYVLSDLLGCVNLYTDANRELRIQAKRLLLGVPTGPSRHDSTYRPMLLLYGIAAFAWKVFVCVSMLWITAGFSHGFGVLLAVFAALLWCLPSLRAGWNEYVTSATHQRRRFVAMMLGTVLVCSISILLIPIPGRSTVNAVIQYSTRPQVRAGLSGFIDEIHVRHGEKVEEGQALITLRNEENRKETALLAIEVEMLRARVRRLTAIGKLASSQATLAKQQAVSHQLSEMLERQEGLTVRAAAPGTVVARNLQSRLGTYVEEGDELLSIVNESDKELVLLFDQSWLDIIQSQNSLNARLRDPGGDLIDIELVQIDPRAQRDIQYTSLYSTNGGPLPVEQLAVDGTKRQLQKQYALLSPHFEASGPLSQDASVRFRSGQRVSVQVRGVSLTLYDLLFRELER